MSSAHVERPSEVVDVGEKVWVKVIGREVQYLHFVQCLPKISATGTMKSVCLAVDRLAPANASMDKLPILISMYAAKSSVVPLEPKLKTTSPCKDIVPL